MAEDSLFNNKQETILEFDPTKDYFGELTGPGGKFHDPDPEKAKQKVAFGKLHSDTYIPTLERRMDEMRYDWAKDREMLNTGPKLQELIDKLALQANSNSEPPNANEQMDKKPVMDPNEVKEWARAAYQEMEQGKVQDQNLQSVKARMEERFGPNYQPILQRQSRELGLTDAMVENLARTAPKAFFKTLGLDEQTKPESFATPPTSNRRNDSFAPQTDKRSWAYYQKLKQEKPDLYNDPKTTAKMHEDYAELGSEFEDGDFHSPKFRTTRP